MAVRMERTMSVRVARGAEGLLASRLGRGYYRCQLINNSNDDYDYYRFQRHSEIAEVCVYPRGTMPYWQGTATMATRACSLRVALHSLIKH